MKLEKWISETLVNALVGLGALDREPKRRKPNKKNKRLKKSK